MMTCDEAAEVHFGTLLGYERLASENGTAIVELRLRAEHGNRGGTVHGGVLMTLLDTAGMWASCVPGEVSTGATVSMSCNFLSAVPLQKYEVVQARARIARRGRTLYFADISAYALPGEKLVATAQAVFSIPVAVSAT